MTETLEIEKTYALDELSTGAKEKARDALRYAEHYLNYEWWDAVYEDAAHIATILGIDLMHTVTFQSGKQHEEPNISFSGFSSQGDGANFRGSYRFNPACLPEIKAYCDDKELIRISVDLFTLQLARKLRGLESFSATITTNGRYSHSGTMSVEVHFEEDVEDPIDAIEDQVSQLMRAFAEWIYETLEAEHDYLMSDEVVDMQLEDQTFDENGSEV